MVLGMIIDNKQVLIQFIDASFPIDTVKIVIKNIEFRNIDFNDIFTKYTNLNYYPMFFNCSFTNCSFGNCFSSLNINPIRYDLSKIHDGRTCSFSDMKATNTKTSIDFSDHFNKCEFIGKIDMSRLFYNTPMERAFMFCIFYNQTQLQEVNLSEMFAECKQLKFIRAINLFDGCKNLVKINISKMFQNCISLQLLRIGCLLGTVSTLKTLNMSKMIEGCRMIDFINDNMLLHTNIEELYDDYI